MINGLGNFHVNICAKVAQELYLRFRQFLSWLVDLLVRMFCPDMLISYADIFGLGELISEADLYTNFAHFLLVC